MTDEELCKALRSRKQKGNRFDILEYEAADRIEALAREVERNAAIAMKALERAQRAEDWRDHDKTRAEAAEAALKEANDREERLRTTVVAAGKIGRIIGFLGDDEARISAFLEACGPGLLDVARAFLAKHGSQK